MALVNADENILSENCKQILFIIGCRGKLRGVKLFPRCDYVRKSVLEKDCAGNYYLDQILKV